MNSYKKRLMFRKINKQIRIDNPQYFINKRKRHYQLHKEELCADSKQFTIEKKLLKNSDWLKEQIVKIIRNVY
jgi:hypothetical protein